MAMSCFSKGMVASSSSTTTSANARHAGRRPPRAFRACPASLARLRMPAVSNIFTGSRTAPPDPVDADGIAGDASLRPGQQTVLAEQAVDQRRLARIGRPDDGDAQRLFVGSVRPRRRPIQASSSSARFRRARSVRAAPRTALRKARSEALAMLGRERDGSPRPELEGFDRSPVRPALLSALLASRITGLPARRTSWAKWRSTASCPVRASMMKKIASAFIARLGLGAHAADSDRVAGLLEAGRIDDA